MRLKSIFRTASLSTALIAAAMISSPRAVAAAAPQEQTSTFDNEKPVTAELRQLRTLMNQLNRDAEQLQSLPHSRLSWASHASQLSQVKDGVNRVGDQLEVLQSMRLSAAPWQQEAINAMLPIAVQVAEHTTAAIEHLSENRQHLWAPQYVEHLRTIPVLSSQMRGLVDNHLKLFEAREKIQNIQGDLAQQAS